MTTHIVICSQGVKHRHHPTLPKSCSCIT